MTAREDAVALVAGMPEPGMYWRLLMALDGIRATYTGRGCLTLVGQAYLGLPTNRRYSKPRPRAIGR